MTAITNIKDALQGCVAKNLTFWFNNSAISRNHPSHRMDFQVPFKWRHFLSDIILLNVRWYSRYSLSYRDLKKMMLEHGSANDPRI